MPWAGNQLEQLGGGVEEVEHLWNEEEEECLAEEAEDARHSQCHTSEVAERVTDKHLGGVPRRMRYAVDLLSITHSQRALLSRRNLK